MKINSIPVIYAESAAYTDIGVAIDKSENIPEDTLKVGQKIIIHSSSDGEIEAYLGHGISNEWVAFLVDGTWKYHLDIEADARLTADVIKQALALSGIKIITEQNDWLLAGSSVSGLTFQAWKNVQETAIKTEGREISQCDTDWKVGTRIHIITYYITRKACTAELNIFIGKILELCEAYFIFSNEYGSVNSIRDSKGYRVYWDTW